MEAEDLEFVHALQEVSWVATEGALESTQEDLEHYVEPETSHSLGRWAVSDVRPTETRSLVSGVARVPEMGEEGSVPSKESGKERRKKRRQRHEPQSIVGECRLCCCFLFQ